ncbi:hypothetical protein, partial [Alsobacter sp. SYSU BS001988]
TIPNSAKEYSAGASTSFAGTSVLEGHSSAQAHLPPASDQAPSAAFVKVDPGLAGLFVDLSDYGYKVG